MLLVIRVPWTRPDSYSLKILKMKIVQGEQLFLKPDRLATLKPHCKIEKPPQYTTFKPSSNWRFYYFYFLLMYTLIAHMRASYKKLKIKKKHQKWEENNDENGRKIDRTRLKSGIKSNQRKSMYNLLSFPPLFRSPLCYVRTTYPTRSEMFHIVDRYWYQPTNLCSEFFFSSFFVRQISFSCTDSKEIIARIRTLSTIRLILSAFIIWDYWRTRQYCEL